MSKTKTLPLAVECLGSIFKTPAASSRLEVFRRSRLTCSSSSDSKQPPCLLRWVHQLSQSSSDPLRKVRKLHFGPRTQDHDAFDRIAELAKIPRPGMLSQGFACLRREARETVSCLESEERQKVVGQAQMS